MKRIGVIKRFFIRLGKKNLQIGIRSFFIGGNYLYFLNTCLLNKTKCDIKELHQLSQELNIPIKLYSWARDEYGTSDGAGWMLIDIEIRPDNTEAEIIEIIKLANQRVNCFCTVNRSGSLEPIRPITS